ncbi:MAG: hypothetical protein KAR56_00240 [Thermoplasmata archaeon]|nr:hypothetical protein [Thermoplasmata archaeon]
MKKLVAMIIAFAMLTAIPLGVIAQENDTVSVDDMAYYDPYYFWPEPGGFDYSNGTADGTYVDFELDEESGTVSDYTVTLIDYINFYSLVSYDDGMPEFRPDDPAEMPEPEEKIFTLFDTIEVENFVANGHPANFGERFIFLGENMMMDFYDCEYASASYQFGTENGTMTIKVAEGLEISEDPYYWDLYEWDQEGLEEWEDWEDDQYEGTDPMPIDEIPEDGIAIEDMQMMGTPYFWSWEEVWLTGDNFTCSVWVDRGSIDIDKVNNTLTINTYKNAWVSFSAWLDMPYCYEYVDEEWYNDLEYDDRGIIETAVEEGLLAAMGYLMVDEESGEDWSNASTFNDPSFQMEFTNIEDNCFDVEVESSIHEGRIVSINVNEGALDADEISDLMVFMDDDEIRACNSLEELTEMQDGTEAGYYVVFGETQTTVFVYVPHFSTHTITVQGIIGSIPNIIVPGVLAAAFIVIALVAVVQRGKKSQDE